MSWEKGSPPSGGSRGRELRSKHLFPMRWLEWRSLTFQGLSSKWLYLKVHQEKQKQELGVGILSSGPYVNVQTLSVSRVIL